MNILLSLLLVFIFLNSVLKLSFWKWGAVAIFTIGVGAFLWNVLDFATEQSQVTLSSLVNDPKVLSDMAVLVTIESAVGMVFCFVSLRDFYQGRQSRWSHILKWFPGVLLFPTLFYGLTQTIFAFPGASFTHLAGWYGMGVIGIILLGSRALKSLLPEKELRLEVHLLMNVFVTLLGLTCTASGQIIYVPHSEPLNWLLLGEIFLFFSGLFVLGFFLKKYFHF